MLKQYCSWRLKERKKGFPGDASGKEPTCNVADKSSIPGSGISPREKNGNPLQYSCLKNPMDRGTWWATVRGVAKNWRRAVIHGVAESQTRLSDWTELRRLSAHAGAKKLTGGCLGDRGSYSRNDGLRRDARRRQKHLPFSRTSLSKTVQFSRVQLFATPWSAARQASLSVSNPQSLPKPMSIELVMPSSHLILCRPLLLLPPVPPSIRVFSNESTLHMKWPNYWGFSFSISPSNEHPGLISFRMDWLDLLAVQGTLKSHIYIHTHTHILFFSILFHYGLLQDIECNSLCYPVGSCLSGL